MANALYDKGREAYLGGDRDWDADTVKIVFVDSADYSIELTTHFKYSEVTAAGRIKISDTALASKTKASGIANAADMTVTDCSGDQFEYIIDLNDTGSETTSLLGFCIDTATGLPCTPNGGDITVQWDEGSNKIFKL